MHPFNTQVLPAKFVPQDRRTNVYFEPVPIAPLSAEGAGVKGGKGVEGESTWGFFLGTVLMTLARWWHEWT